ncbi:MAG: DUF1778 domain-containing protein [Actinomycetota bacterium]
MTPRSPHALKAERLHLRATEDQAEMIERAAEATAKTVSAFVLDAAGLEAQRVLADRRRFMLDPEQWKRFVELLDRPATPKPRLHRLVRQPGALDQT